MEYVYPAIFGLLTLVSLIMFIMILIKSFSEGGLLHGILGIFTCGLYTYIWGWIKSKELQLFKTMLLWTIVMILPYVLIFFIGTSALMAAIPMANELGLQVQTPKAGKSSKKNKKRTAKKAGRKKAGAKKKKSPAPKTPVQFNDRAVALWKNGKYTNPGKASSFLGKAIEKDPNFAHAYVNRGNAYRDLKQYQQALQDYNKAISLKPNFIMAYNNRGNIYFDQKNYQMAIRDYNKSIAMKPTYKLAFLNRGLAYHALKRNNLACTDFKKACQLGDCDGINWAKQNGICK
jgi:Flp pilus assembly protein TadD